MPTPFHASESLAPIGRVTRHLLVLPLALMSTESALAALELGATARLGYIENMQAAVASDEAELLRELQLDLGYQRDSARFSANIDYTGNKLDYHKGILQDRSYFSGSSSLVWTAIRDTLTWSVSNSRSFQLLNILQADTSDNRQIINTTATGPRLTTRLGSTNVLNAGLDYSTTDYSLSVTDQKRKSAFIALSRYFSPRYIATLNANAVQANFDLIDALNFEIHTVSLDQTYAVSTYELGLELGVNEIKREMMPTQDNLLVRLEGSYRPNARSQVSVSFSDSAEDLLSNLQNAQLNPGNMPEIPAGLENVLGGRFGNSSQAQAYRQIQKSLSYTYSVPDRWSIGVQYQHVKRLFEDDQESQSDENVSLNAFWPINPRLKVNLFARYSDLAFPQQLARQERREYGASTNYLLSQSLRLQFSILNTEQTGSSIQDGINAFMAVSFSY